MCPGINHAIILVYIYKIKPMKILKIYNIIASILLLVATIWVKQLRKELRETEDLLQRCSDRYYKEVMKDKSSEYFP